MSRVLSDLGLINETKPVAGVDVILVISNVIGSTRAKIFQGAGQALIMKLSQPLNF